MLKLISLQVHILRYHYHRVTMTKVCYDEKHTYLYIIQETIRKPNFVRHRNIVLISLITFTALSAQWYTASLWWTYCTQGQWRLSGSDPQILTTDLMPSTMVQAFMNTLRVFKHLHVLVVGSLQSGRNVLITAGSHDIPPRYDECDDKHQ